MTEGGQHFDAAILGGGAAGLVAAIHAAERGRSVVLLEKNRRLGVKILISGGTRCNLTNARGLRSLRGVTGPIDPAYDPAQAKGARSIQEAFGPGGSFLGPALKCFSVEASVALFEDEGVPTKIEANGKVFPASDRAVDVADALVRRLSRSGAVVRNECPALGVNACHSGFEVQVRDGMIRASRVILAMGGQSYPGCGTRGDGYAIARGLGHTIVPPRPALVPIRVGCEWASGLSGLTLPDIRATVQENGGPPLIERRESALFAHFGLTGPAILDVSRAVARHEGTNGLILKLDLAPAERFDALEAALQKASRAGKGLVVGMLPGPVPRRLAEIVVAESGIPPSRTGPELSREERRLLIASLKGLPLRVTGTLGFTKAEVTSGGVALGEVNPQTMESRIHPGFFFAGEVLDVDGFIGGYNFQAAWSTGWLAAESV